MNALLLALFAIVPLASGEPPQTETSDAFALHDFAGDLITPFGESSAYGSTRFQYAEAASLPTTVRARLATIMRGLTRDQLLEHCNENGGLTVNEFFLRDIILDGHTVAIRVALRHAAMPEAIYSDPDKRCAWLSKHKPLPTPKDTVVRVSKPFLSHVVID